MLVVEDIIPWLAIGLSVSAWLVYWLQARTFKKIEPDDVAKAILSEMNRRLEAQNKRIIDQQVRLDILELRLERMPSRIQEAPRQVAPPTSQKPIASRTSQSVVEPSDPTARQVIELLKEGPRTSREIEKHIRRSREHTARLLKKLYDDGLVERDTSERPFRYRLRRT